MAPSSGELFGHCEYIFLCVNMHLDYHNNLLTILFRFYALDNIDRLSAT